MSTDFLAQMQAKYKNAPANPTAPSATPIKPTGGDFLSQMQSKYGTQKSPPSVPVVSPALNDEIAKQAAGSISASFAASKPVAKKQLSSPIESALSFMTQAPKTPEQTYREESQKKFPNLFTPAGTPKYDTMLSPQELAQKNARPPVQPTISAATPYTQQRMANQDQQRAVDQATAKDEWIRKKLGSGMTLNADVYERIKTNQPDKIKKLSEEYDSERGIANFLGNVSTAFDKDIVQRFGGIEKVSEQEVKSAMMQAANPKAMITAATIGIINGEDIGNIGQDVYTKNGKTYYKGFEIGDEYLTKAGKNTKLGADIVAGFIGGLPTYGGISKAISSGVSKLAAANLPKFFQGISKVAKGIEKAKEIAPFLTEMTVFNSLEEGTEAGIRKATGQEYTFNDFLQGLAIGAGMGATIKIGTESVHTAEIMKFLNKVENVLNQRIDTPPDIESLKSIDLAGKPVGEWMEKATPKPAEEKTAIEQAIDAMQNPTGKIDVLPEPVRPVEITAPKETLMLKEAAAPDRTQGEGFTIAPKTVKENIAIMKSITTYRDEVAKFNKKPTPEGVARVQKAREIMDGLMNTNALSEQAMQGIKESGGSTLDQAGNSPKSGYTYAPSKATETIIPKSSYSKTNYFEFAKKYKNELNKDGNHIGIYEDGDNYVLDITRNTGSLKDAIDGAKSSNQNSIYDVKNNSLIYNTEYEKAYSDDRSPRENGRPDSGGDRGSNPEVQGTASEIARSGTGDVVRPTPQTATPKVKTLREPTKYIADGANTYNTENGAPAINHSAKVTVDESFARRIADAYDNLKADNSSDPAVKKAYTALSDEVRKQWDFVTNKMGIKMEAWTKDGQPYANSAEMQKDLADNKHLYFFTGGEPHPFLGKVDPETGYNANEMLRGIHDVFGHAAGGNTFSALGEENAWNLHSQMFSPEATKALTTETRGQNSWVNFNKDNYVDGVHTDRPLPDRPYAQQKVDLLPDEFQRKASPQKAEEATIGSRKAIDEPASEQNPLAAEAKKYKSAEEFASKFARDSGLSLNPKIQTIDLTRIKGSDYPELDSALKSGKKLTLDEASNIVTDNEQMAAKKGIINPIEVRKNADGSYNLQAGNHRVAQALINGDKTIMANVIGSREGASLADIWNQANKPSETPAVTPKEPSIQKESPKSDKFQSRVFERLKAEHPELLEGDLEQTSIKLKEDLDRATDLIAKNKDKAYRIAMGMEKSSDILSASANIVLAEKALADGNHSLYAQLVRNRSLGQTRRGQEISAERGSVSDNSTSRYVKDLLSTRLDKLGAEYLGDVKDFLSKKSNPTKRAMKIIDEEVGKIEKVIKNTKSLDLSEAQKLIDSLTC